MRGKFILINFCLKTIINQKQAMCHFMVRSTPTHCWPELRQHLVERTNYFSYMQRLAYVNVNPVLASPTQRQQKQCVGEGWGCFLLSRWKILCSLEELLTVLENKSYWVSLSLAHLEQRKKSSKPFYLVFKAESSFYHCPGFFTLLSGCEISGNLLLFSVASPTECDLILWNTYLFLFGGEKKAKVIIFMEGAAVGQFEMLKDIWEEAFSGWRRYCTKKL